MDRSPAISIGVVGSSTPVHSQFIRGLCEALGYAILEHGFALTVEKRGGVGDYAIVGARAFIRERSLPEEARIWIVRKLVRERSLPEDDRIWRTPEFTFAGATALGQSPGATAEATALPSVFILISGGRPAERIIEAARSAGIPIVPIGVTGGAAKHAWLATRKSLARSFSGRVNESEFARLNDADEPQILAALAVDIAARLAAAPEPTHPFLADSERP